MKMLGLFWLFRSCICLNRTISCEQHRFLVLSIDWLGLDKLVALDEICRNADKYEPEVQNHGPIHCGQIHRDREREERENEDDNNVDEREDIDNQTGCLADRPGSRGRRRACELTPGKKTDCIEVGAVVGRHHEGDHGIECRRAADVLDYWA